MSARTETDLEGIDRAFRAALAEPLAPPTRFYLNLSEVCQLRCAHCITLAPSLTHSGKARSMGPEVLEALAPHLAHAQYVGFTHAGEPLLAPGLLPVLRQLRTTRAGEPTVVHLLTNGMALTREKFEQLVELGVCSWSFSLDGMSARTNDELRVGARIELLLARIRELAAHPLRHERGLRMGIAWTLGRANAEELPALLHFAHTAALDWVKLEEMDPVNAVAAAQVLPEPRLREAVAHASALAQAMKLPLLDHTRSPSVWKCQLEQDAQLARFSRLDDWVNRMEINPCRLPYELVCIEPNGEVKPLSFHERSAGNLLDTDLLALWRSPAFAAARATMAARRPCGAGPATCSPDLGPSRW